MTAALVVAPFASANHTAGLPLDFVLSSAPGFQSGTFTMFKEVHGPGGLVAIESCETWIGDEATIVPFFLHAQAVDVTTHFAVLTSVESITFIVGKFTPGFGITPLGTAVVVPPAIVLDETIVESVLIEGSFYEVGDRPALRICVAFLPGLGGGGVTGAAVLDPAVGSSMVTYSAFEGIPPYPVPELGTLVFSTAALGMVGAASMVRRRR